MDDREELAALRRLAELEQRANTSGQPVTPPQGGGMLTPNSTTSQQPDASGQVAPPLNGGLAQTLRQMGEESSGVGKLGLGLAQSGARTARALGIPQSLRAMGVPLDPQGDEALDAVAKGTGALGTTGDLAGTFTQALAGGGTLAKAVPQGVKALALQYPKLAAYLGAAGGSAGVTAAMTPGDLGERGKEAAIAAALALPLTAVARTIAKPAAMSEIGQNLRAATGEMPPLHIGAESKLIQDVGNVLKEIPGIGAPLVAGEKRVFSAGVKQLWEHATPPGQPNLLEAGGKVERGPLFEALKGQFDQTYDGLLKGLRISTTNADRQAITKLIDNAHVPEDAARLHKIMDKYFPQGTSIGGRSWKELQEIVRSEGARFSGNEKSAVEQSMGDTLGKIDDYLIKMRNKFVPKDVAQKLDATDQAYAVRKLLEKSVSGSKGYEEMNPTKLASALAARTSEGAQARGHGTAQTLIDSMAASMGNMDLKNTGQGLWGLRRLIAPTIAAGVAGGLPGAAVPASVTAGMTLAGSGPRGAKALFGEYPAQKALAEFLRLHPSALPSSAAGLEVQSQE